MWQRKHRAFRAIWIFWAKRLFLVAIFCLEYPSRCSEKVTCHFVNCRFSFRKLQIFISVRFANYSKPMHSFICLSVIKFSHPFFLLKGWCHHICATTFQGIVLNSIRKTLFWIEESCSKHHTCTTCLFELTLNRFMYTRTVVIQSAKKWTSYIVLYSLQCLGPYKEAS